MRSGDEAVAFLDELRAFPTAPTGYPLIVSAVEAEAGERLRAGDAGRFRAHRSVSKKAART